MGISDYLRARLAGFPGIETASAELVGGAQIIHINGVEAHTGPFASDTEIERAIRSALNMADPDATEPNVTPMPTVALIEEPKPQEEIITKSDEIKGLAAKSSEKGITPLPVGKPIPSSGGYTPGSLKSLLQGLQKRNADVMSETVKKVQRVHKVLDQVVQVGADADATAAAILADLGQFSNFPDDEG